MSKRNFHELLEAQWAKDKFVCVGLDSDVSKIPGGEDQLAFNRRIIGDTADIVGTYKPNSAFYEARGPAGIEALRDTVAHSHEAAPEVPVILDAKRGDIGNTNNGYVEFVFEYLKVDAVTVQPYLGGESLQPFLGCVDKGIIVLCKTSNPGSGEFQDLHTTTLDPSKKPGGMSAEQWLEQLCQDAKQLYQRVAYNVANHWNKNNNCLVVVGATYPVQGKEVREIVQDDVPFLIPGIGKQGGDVEATVLNCADGRSWGMIINSSRGVIFADDPRAEAQKLHDLINKHRKKKATP